jgi:KUP system potassium uptake protein
MAALAYGTLGVVFGDIGTSPLYAFRESFEHAELSVTPDNAYGVASIVFWSLIIVISLKYLFLVMRADNHGEGGILALTALVMPSPGTSPTRVGAAVISLGVFGTALLYGDGLITPAISVLSAVEGFEVATSAFEAWVIPVAIARSPRGGSGRRRIVARQLAIQRGGIDAEDLGRAGLVAGGRLENPEDVGTFNHFKCGIVR